jgi:hypothetical protein
MMQARRRFRQICRFGRMDDPFMWSVHAWNATLDRWVREGMPVSNLDSRKETNMPFLMVPPDVPYENMVYFCNEVRS